MVRRRALGVRLVRRGRGFRVRLARRRRAFRVRLARRESGLGACRERGGISGAVGASRKKIRGPPRVEKVGI